MVTKKDMPQGSANQLFRQYHSFSTA